MKLLKLTMVESPGTVDNYIRPFEINYKRSFIDDVSNATDGGLRLTPHRLAGVAGGILTPTAAGVRAANIPNGWGSGRIMFAMVVELATREITRDYEYIVGFTDHPEYSDTGNGRISFDSNMRMYFNSITRVHLTESTLHAGGGRSWVPKINSHDQVLNRSALIGEGRRRGADNSRPATTRPCDLFRRADSVNSFGGHMDEFSNNGGNSINLTGSFSSALRSSTRLNNSATMNLSRSLKAYSAANSDPHTAYLGDQDEGEVIRGATDAVEENVVNMDPVISMMKEQSNILSSGYITFGELMEMNPDFDEDRDLPFHSLKSRRKLRGFRGEETVSDWNGSDPETIAATIIAQSLPGIMINSMYSKVENLILDSHARPGESKVNCGLISPFMDGVDIRSNWTYFEDQCEFVLLRELTKDGLFDVTCTIDANIDQDIYITISLDGGLDQQFRFPAFGDGFVAPVLATDVRQVELLAKSLVSLAGGVSNSTIRDHQSTSSKVPSLILPDAHSGRLPVAEEPPKRANSNKRSW